jgi:uncharacterized membrane protein required for colicin V production
MPLLWFIDKLLGFVTDSLKPILLLAAAIYAAQYYGLIDVTSLIPDPLDLLGLAVVVVL